MGNLGGLICVFLMAFGPHLCMAQSLIMGQVDRLVKDLDRMVQTAKTDAKLYVTELEGLFDNLNTTASIDLAHFDSTVNDFTTSVNSKVDGLAADAGDTEISKCTDLATPVLSTASEILTNGTYCITEEVQQAEREIALLVPYIDSQLNTLALSKSWAEHCVSRFHESEQTSSDAMQAFACVQPIHRSAELVFFRFELIIDIGMTEDLFHGYETRLAECNRYSSRKLESLASTGQDVLGEISTCVTEAIGSSL